jgi:hypothetical protein
MLFVAYSRVLSSTRRSALDSFLATRPSAHLSARSRHGVTGRVRDIGNIVFCSFDRALGFYSTDRSAGVCNSMAESELLSAQFTCQVTDANLERYKLTVAIAELHLGTIIGHAVPQFAGLAYPSVRASANSDNLALLPWFVDQHLRFRKAVHVRRNTISNSTFSITSCDAAKEFDDKG